MIRITRLPRLYRLLKLARLLRILKLFKRSALFLKIQTILKFNNSAMRLATFFVTVLLCVHLSGCLWIILAQLADYNPYTWVSRIGLADSDNFSIYLAAIYWAI